ncbi:rasp f 7 allergen [Apiospora arundinis]
MKSTTFATALLASVAIAQPHGHARRHLHDKRDLVVEWTTEWVTETVWVDDGATSTAAAAASTTAAPAANPTPSSKAPAQFFEAPTQAKPSVPEVKPTVEAVKPVEPSPEPVTTSPPPPPVVQPTTLIPAPKPTVVAPPPPPPPAPTTVVAPPPPVQSTAQPAPAPAPSAPSAPSTGGGEKKFTGDITYYAPAPPKGNVVAVAKDWFMKVGNGKTSLGVNQPANILCDKTITISAKGKTTTAVIRDSCPGCAPGSIDVTEGAFKELFGSLDVGRGEVTWWLNEAVPGA